MPKHIPAITSVKLCMPKYILAVRQTKSSVCFHKLKKKVA
jgi:hypothetical protein